MDIVQCILHIFFQMIIEIMVRNIINKNFDGFIHDKPLYTGNCDCTHRSRIEHFLISLCEIKKRIHYKFAKRIYMNHRKLICIS
jgi:hypothetical protein